MPDPVQLRCSDLWYYADLLLDLFADGTFGAHAYEDLDGDECFCAESVDPDSWDADNRRERNRTCDAPVMVIRPGFELIACCRCADGAGVDDDTLAEAGRRIVEEKRALERARASLPSVQGRLAAELEASRLLLAAGHLPERVAAAGRALHEVTR